MTIRPSTRRVAVLMAVFAVSLSAYGGDGKIHRVGRKLEKSYIVMLNKGEQAELIGPELEKRHGGKLQGLMKHLDMFSIRLPNEAAAEALARDPRVAEVEEDEVLYAASCNRALDSSGAQWALAYTQDRNMPSRFSDVPGISINQVRVYVIDTAIDMTVCVPSTDLRVVPYANSKVSQTDATIGCDGGGGEDPNGPHDLTMSVGLFGTHGTAVTSLLAGNSYGVVPEVNTIVSVVALDCTGRGTTTSVTLAGDYVVADHLAGQPAVANVSIGGNNDALYSMLKRIVDDGVFVAAAAGNDGHDACTTTSAGKLSGTSGYPGLMVVGATTIYGYQAPYSNYGNCVNIWAPGGDQGHPVATSVGTAYGTSLSAPEVAGAAVLIFSKYPTWTATDVWAQIKYFQSPPSFGLPTLFIALPDSCCPLGWDGHPQCSY